MNAWLRALLAAAALVRLAGAAEPFHFVQLTDLHLGGGPDHLQRANAAVDQINALPLPVACVLVTGDLCRDDLDDTQAVARIHRVLNRLRPPVRVIPGNHDVLVKRWTATTNTYVREFGPLATNFTCHGVRFLALCDEPLHEASFAAAHPDWNPLVWLEGQLAGATNLPVIVVHHRPCTEDFHNNTFFPGWPEPTRKAWQDLLNRYDVRAEIVGHFHRDELAWDGRVPVFIAAPLAGYYGRQASFRIYTWADGQLSYRTLYLD